MTGAATFVGGVGTSFQGLAWDSTRNVMTAFDGSQIIAVNVTNAALTLLAFTEFVGDHGMTYDPVIVRPVRRDPRPARGLPDDPTTASEL